MDLGNLCEQLEDAARTNNYTFISLANQKMIEEAEKLLDYLQKVQAEWKKTEQRRIILDYPDADILRQIKEAAIDYNPGRIEELLDMIDQFNYRKRAELSEKLRDFLLVSNFEAITRILS
jgi:hypothetical protein